ncbi:hypothetical protein MAR_033049, partial [Mya arenaria]
MAAREPAGNSHLKASEPNTENLPPAQPETRPEQGHPLQETLASDLGHDSLVVHHSGPALTLTHQSINTDTVIALPIQQQMLSEWISRPRHHSWPSPELKQEISKLGAYLVPVGCKGSETKHMEWRVGFIGEQKLTDSFTECQYKLYNVLKFLMKTELKPICDEMSSYI